jgi:predicted ArsR family transcriptional regulator
MQKTRKKITDYLVDNPRVTAIELSRVLNMTVANVRHHLSILEKETIIEALGNLPSNGKGRPTTVYSLSRNKNNFQIVALANILLDIITKTNKITFKKSLTTIANALIGDAPEKISPLPIRLNQACGRLDELGYQSQWEAHKNGPIIILGQCPYASIIKNHPELCELDQLVISKLSNSPCQQTSKIDRLPGGSAQCTFQLIQQ